MKKSYFSFEKNDNPYVQQDRILQASVDFTNPFDLQTLMAQILDQLNENEIAIIL